MVFDEYIKSLQTRVNGEPQSMPIIELESGEQVEISFDALGHDYNRFAYGIEHCDADWKPSSLSSLEYMEGMPGTTIDDYVGSTNTTVEYTNYRLLLPNEDVRLKASGNYAVRIYREGEPDKTLLTVCFSAAERQVAIQAERTGNTSIDFNKTHQQVNFSLSFQQFKIDNPLTELKVFVYQNGRRDNAATEVKPSAILHDRIIYEQIRQLVFEAGNEYRRFEFLTGSYNGMGVENIRFYNPNYHVTLQTDAARGQIAYRYDQDQEGCFFIRCRKCSEADREADYYFVHFSLKSSELPGGSLYLLGDIFNNAMDERSRMNYNSQAGQYEKYALLKQGHYNYSYIFKADGQSAGRLSPVEGSFFQTSNEYTIMVYYRPFAGRYDRLIGELRIGK